MSVVDSTPPGVFASAKKLCDINHVSDRKEIGGNLEKSVKRTRSPVPQLIMREDHRERRAILSRVVQRKSCVSRAKRCVRVRGVYAAAR